MALLVLVVEATVYVLAWAIGVALVVSIGACVLLFRLAVFVAGVAAARWETADRRRHPERYGLDYVSTRR